MTGWQIYWLLQLDAINTMFLIFSIIFSIASVFWAVFSVGYRIDGTEDEIRLINQFTGRPFRRSSLAGLAPAATRAMQKNRKNSPPGGASSHRMQRLALLALQRLVELLVDVVALEDG